MADMVGLSPIQLKQLNFTKVYVEPFSLNENPEAFWAPTFDFRGVNFKIQMSSGIQSGQEEDPRDFVISVGITIVNDDPAAKQSPYVVDVHAHGFFSIEPEFAAVDKREELVRVNGGSMVIGAIRELVTQITSRSVFGPMTLPSLRILPEKK